MEVKTGYMQTEMGVIPEDWGDLTLLEIARDDSPICYGIVQVGPYDRNGIPVLAIKNLNTDYATNIHRASVAVECPYSRSRVRPNDLLISVKGTTGRVGIVPAGFHGNISRDLARVRPRERIDPNFCFQMLQSELAQRRLAVAVVGTTRMELSIAILKQVRIPLPPTNAEQQAIAEALSDADALIESLEQLVAKKRQIKQGAMQELLTGKKRLPGFREAWEVKRLRDVCRSIVDGTHFTPRYVDFGVPFYSVENVTANDFINTKYITQDEHRRLSKRCKPEKGDILLTRIGSIGDTKLIDWDVEASIYVSLAILKVGEQVDARYLYCYSKSRQFITDIEDRSLMNASPKKINMGEIGEVPIAFPSIPEQTAIASNLSDMDAEIDALEAKIDKARHLKQGMMQELLTGRIRLV